MTWIKIDRKIFLFTFILIAISIGILSLLPPKSALNLGSNDKISHFIAYFVLSLNGLLVWRISNKTFWLISAIISYGLLLEFLQGFVPGRYTSLLDVIANTIGVLFGFIINMIFLKIIKL
jgi:VanZ family protein